MSRGWLVLLAFAVAAAVGFILLAGGDPESTPPDLARKEVSPPTTPVLFGTAEAEATRPEGGSEAMGLVVGPDGEGVAGVRVEVRRNQRVESQGFDRSLDQAFRTVVPRVVIARTTTREDGTFMLSGLDDETLYVYASVPAPPLTGTSLRGTPRSYEGKVLRLRVVEGTPLRGRFVDAGGARAWVTLRVYGGTLAWRPGRAALDLEDQPVDAAGRFAFPAAPEGMGTLYVRIPGRIARSFSVRLPHAGELQLRLFEEDGASVAGRVHDALGTPIPGAEVVVGVTKPGSHGIPDATAMATTGEDGRYEIVGLPAALLGNVHVRARGYVPATVRGGQRPLAAGRAETIDVELSRGARLEGTVRDDKGAPMEGVELTTRISVPGSFRNLSSVTDAEGRYLFEGLTKGKLRVTVHYEGWYLPTQKDGRIAGERPSTLDVMMGGAGTSITRDVQLARGTHAEGRCVTEGGASLADVRVEARTNTGLPFEEATSDADGRFTFPGLAPHTAWTLTATKPGWLGTAKLERPLEIVLRPTATLEGTVVTPEGPVPSGERLRVELQGASRNGYLEDDGRFRFADLAAGTYRLQVGTASGTDLGERHEVELAWGESADMTLDLGPIRVLAGTLVDGAGQPLPEQGLGFRIAGRTSWPSATATTDGEGHFEAQTWEDGEYEAVVKGRRLEGTFPAGATGLRLRYDPREEAYVVLRIVDAEGARVARCRLTRMRQDGSGWQSVDTTVDGGQVRLARTLLQPRTDVRVFDARDPQGQRINALPKRVVNVQDVADDELVVRLEAGLVLRGQIIDEEGSSVEGVRVSAGNRSEGWGDCIATSDTEGRFAIPCLPRDTWPLFVHVGSQAPWLPHPPLEVASPDQEPVLRLDRGIDLRVELLDPEGQSIEGVRLSVTGRMHGQRWSRTGTTDEQGEVVVEGVPAHGSFDARTVRLPRDCPYPRQSFLDQRARDGQLKLRLEAGVTIGGQVVDEEGRPLPGATVQAYGVQENAHARYLERELEGESRFVLGPLTPGRYRVFATAGTGRAPSKHVEARAPAADIRLEVPRAVSVTGRVPTQGAMSNVSVRWHVDDEAKWGGADAEGRFTLDGLRDEPGTLYVRPDHRGDAFWLREDARPTEGPFVVRAYEQGVHVRGRLEGYAPRAHPELYVELARGALRLGAQPLPGGTFELRAVPPGRYDVEIRQEGRTVTTSRGVEVGEDELVLAMPR